MRDEKERILDILEAIERIQKYAARGREAFDHDELIQNWIVHHLQIIGEAAANISDEFADAHPEIPWPKIIGMRNILVHHYFGIDLNVVWSAVENDLPPLEGNLKKAI
jgi:uncharacterized protein with HEPN domain